VRKLLTIFFILIVFIGIAQNSNKKRVLVIPPSRFEFMSKYSLEEIAEKNESSASEVFVLYEKALLNSFSNYKDENFEFVPVEAGLLQPYKKLIKYEYGKFNGKRYNAVNLNGFSKKEFTQLLEQQNADFVIFITWYTIEKESFTRKGKHSKRTTYAGHYMDYAIYNLFKEQLVGLAKVKAEANEPNDLEASFSLLRTIELGSAYNNFIYKIVEQLSKPIKQ